MAFRSNGPMMVALPAFRGTTRRIVLVYVAANFANLLFGATLPRVQSIIVDHLLLHPIAVMHGEIWQVSTYPFFDASLLTVLFAALSIWFTGTVLEDTRGSRWLGEFFLVSVVGGALLASLFTVAASHVVNFDPSLRALGMWPFALALMMAFAMMSPDQELTFNFLIRVKAKYLLAIFTALALGSALSGRDYLQATLLLTTMLSGYLYLRLVPRRGLSSGMSESWYGLRNAYYRHKRQKAARKFKVYMNKQGKDVSIDSDGRYVDPQGKPRDPNDKKWMN